MLVREPMPLDFAALADGVRRNNMGTGGFRVQAKTSADGSTLKILPTGQSFPLGKGPAESSTAWRTFRVLDWNDPAKTKVEIVP